MRRAKPASPEADLQQRLKGSLADHWSSAYTDDGPEQPDLAEYELPLPDEPSAEKGDTVRPVDDSYAQHPRGNTG